MCRTWTIVARVKGLVSIRINEQQHRKGNLLLAFVQYCRQLYTWLRALPRWAFQRWLSWRLKGRRTWRMLPTLVMFEAFSSHSRAVRTLENMSPRVFMRATTSLSLRARLFWLTNRSRKVCFGLSLSVCLSVYLSHTFLLNECFCCCCTILACVYLFSLFFPFRFLFVMGQMAF